MFTGRPPGLSHRYQSCPLPLDLDDDVLMVGGAKLSEAIANLDKNGWDKTGRVSDATVCRVRALYSMVLDDIMEVFLGNQTQWSLDRVL